MNVLTVADVRDEAAPPAPAKRPGPTRQVVLYRLSQYDAAAITARRTAQGVTGNAVAAGKSYPALIVQRFSYTTANLRVLLDGPDDLWATSRTYGDLPGQWRDYEGDED